METYNGLVRTPTDAIILFEACRLGLLPRVQRRLSEKERMSIRSGSVFVWDEREAGMRRWTDGKSWSASRVSGSFLTYREMEGRRSTSLGTPAARTTKTPESGNGDDSQDGPLDSDVGPDGYRYKPDGLNKQSFSITTSQGQHLHLISYFSRLAPTSQVLRQPSQDPNLASIQPAKGMYPESTVNDVSTVPAVTRSPMPGAPNYVVAPSPPYGRAAPPPHAYLPHGYVPHPAYMAYPLSPMHTPPAYALHPAYAAAGLPPMGFHSYGHPGHPQPLPINHAPPSSYDQRPARLSDSLHRPPSHHNLTQHHAVLPPYTQSQPPPPVTQSYQPSTYATSAAPTQSGGSEHTPSSSFQIDPRLTAPPPPVAAAQPASSAPAPISAPRARTPDASEPMQHGTPVHSGAVGHSHANGANTASATPATASQAPTITSMVHEAPAISVGGKLPNEGDAERQGSASPGGTQSSAPPQDIPSEKLGFREDKRALSMLDRAFARV